MIHRERIKNLNLQQKGSLVSLILTFIFWLSLLIGSLFIKLPQKQPKFKTVQIVLSEPVKKTEPKKEQKQESSSVSSQQAKAESQKAVEKTVEKPVEQPAQKKVEKPAVKEAAIKETKTQPKPAPSKPKSEPQKAPAQTKKPASNTPKQDISKQKPVAPIEPETYAMDMSGDIDFGSNKKQAKNFDDMFDAMFDYEDDSPVKASSQAKVTGTSGMTGSAGSTTTASNQKVKTETQTSNAQSKASSDVKGSLTNIKNTFIN